MGGESNLLDLIKYRKPMKGERKMKVFSFLEKLRMALLPKDFVESNIKVLRRILDEGHELGIHSWKHRAWTRGIDQIDVREHIIMAKKRYSQVFNKKPNSFAAPGFVSNNQILRILEEEGFRVISDLPGEKVKRAGKGLTNVPITITGENNSPLIESLASKGLSDKEIIKKVEDEIQKRDLATLYGHCLFECIDKICVIEELLKFVKKKGFRIKRIDKIAG